MTRPCLWCHRPLRFLVGQGWVHEDGRTVVTRIDAAGVELDDHVALPDANARNA